MGWTGAFEPYYSTAKPVQHETVKVFIMSKNIYCAIGLDYSTPLAMMTLGQLVEVIRQTTPPVPQQKDQIFVYGLRGIQELFGVSHKTAQHWKNTWLAPACLQLGKTIIVDREKALKLFEETGRRWSDYGK